VFLITVHTVTSFTLSRWCGLPMSTELRWDGQHLLSSRPLWWNLAVKLCSSPTSAGCCSDTIKPAQVKSGKVKHTDLMRCQLDTRFYIQYRAWMLAYCFQRLLHRPNQCHSLHCQRTMAVLGALVQRGVLSLLGGPAYPPKGALSHLAHGKHLRSGLILVRWLLFLLLLTS